MSTKVQKCEHDVNPTRVSPLPLVTPDVSARDDGQTVTLVADMPGVGPGDVNVTYEKGALRVEGTPARTDPENVEMLLAERWDAKYVRTFSLSDEIDASGIKATVKNGVVTVTLPRHEHAKARQIQVEAA